MGAFRRSRKHCTESMVRQTKKRVFFFVLSFLLFLIGFFSCSFAGIYDINIDIPEQKLTIIGWADPEIIMKAIKKTRKTATICSDAEADAGGQPPDYMLAGGGEQPNYSPNQGLPQTYDMAMVGEAQQYDQTNAQQEPQQPYGSYEPGGQVQDNTHQQPQEYGYVQQYTTEPGHDISHQQPPEYGQPSDHNHMANQPPDYSQGGHHQQPPEQSYGQVVHHHQPHNSSHNYHHSIPQGAMSQPATVIHCYNTYKPSSYVTQYVRPPTCHRPSSRTSEYIPQRPTTHYSQRTEHYNEDYYNTGTSSYNGNITSIFSDENPNACNLM